MIWIAIGLGDGLSLIWGHSINDLSLITLKITSCHDNANFVRARHLKVLFIGDP